MRRFQTLWRSLALGLILLMAGGLFVGKTAKAEDYVAEGIEITLDGVTYTCDFTSSGNAEIYSIIAATNTTRVAVPETLTHDNRNYTVVKIFFSRSCSGDNVTEFTLPNTLQAMTGYGFSNFEKVTELTIPGSIKDFSFSLQNSNIKKLTLAEGVESIQDSPVANTPIEEIVLPSTLKTLGNAAFFGATQLKAIDLPEGVTLADNAAGIFSDCSSLTHIRLPASIDRLASGMFKNCTALTSIDLPASITQIPSSAFYGCTSLRTVTAESPITKIEANAFQDCTALETIPDLGRVTDLGVSAFFNCNALCCDVNLSSLKMLEANVFCYTQVIVTDFCDTLESIGDWALIWAMVKAELPPTLQSIGSYTFFGGNLPETLTIPDSVRTIGNYAFASTAGVKKVFIGSNLSSISKGLFADSSVKEITLNASKDELTGTENLPDKAKIIYRYPSISDSVGDTISDASGAPTLQAAIYNAPNGQPTTITIGKNVKLSQTLRVPAGKAITLTSDQPYTILAVKTSSAARGTSSVDDLIVVEKGASLTLAGNITLRGKYNTGHIIDNSGAVTLTDNVVVCDSTLKRANTGVIDNHADSATFTMLGGVVEKNTVTDAYSGTIRATNGAKLFIRGGKIQNNQTIGRDTYLSSAGLMLFENGAAEMTGGSISGNSGYRGSAVMMYSENSRKRAAFTMSGGDISKNTSKRLDSGWAYPSGAVHVERYSDFTLSGGTITENRATGAGAVGGGVCVIDMGCQSNAPANETRFTMLGGEISKNTSSEAGGGVYSYSNHVRLLAGAIKNNRSNKGGGVYSEGNTNLGYSTLYMENVSITGNHATKQGGGMWSCPTGDAKVYVSNGGLIEGNTADEAGDDMVFLGFPNDPYTLTLANYTPDGRRVKWMQDGGLFPPNGTYAATNASIPRYHQNGANTAPMTFENATPNIALKAVLDYPSTMVPKLVITGNTAVYGGGVGSNGGVNIGENKSISVSVQKKWSHGDNPVAIRPQDVTIYLKNGDAIVDRLLLNADNQWSGTFSGLPTDGRYTVDEESVPNYAKEISGDAQHGFTVKNTYSGDIAETAKELPKTGDDTPLLPLLALAALSVLGLHRMRKAAR